MVSTARAAAPAVGSRGVPFTAKGPVAWFKRQPMALRIVIVVVAIILLPTVLGLIVALFKGLRGAASMASSKMKGGFSMRRKAPAPSPEPAPDPKADLESK